MRTSPLRTASSTSACPRMVERYWAVQDPEAIRRVSDGLGWVAVCEGVKPPGTGECLEVNIIFFSDGSGTEQRSPTVGCASVPVSCRAEGLHVEHHTGATIFGASSRGQLRTLADTVSTTPQPASSG